MSRPAVVNSLDFCAAEMARLRARVCIHCCLRNVFAPCSYECVGSSAAFTRLIERAPASLDSLAHAGDVAQFLTADTSDSVPFDLVLLPLWRWSLGGRAGLASADALITAAYRKIKRGGTLLVFEVDATAGVFACRAEVRAQLPAAVHESAHSFPASSRSGTAVSGAGAGSPSCFKRCDGMPQLDAPALYAALSRADDATAKGESESDATVQTDEPLLFCEPADAGVDLTAAVAETERAIQAAAAAIAAGRSSPKKPSERVRVRLQAACAALTEAYGCDAQQILASYPAVAASLLDELTRLSLFNVRSKAGADGTAGGDDGAGVAPVVGHVPMRVWHVMRASAAQAAALRQRDVALAAAARAAAERSGDSDGADAAASGSGASGKGGLLSAVPVLDAFSSVAYSALEVVTKRTMGGVSSLSTLLSVSATSTTQAAGAPRPLSGSSSPVVSQEAIEAAKNRAPGTKWWLLGCESGGEADGSTVSTSASDNKGDVASFSPYWHRLPTGSARAFLSRSYRTFPFALPPMPLLYAVPGVLSYDAEGAHQLPCRRRQSAASGHAAIADKAAVPARGRSLPGSASAGTKVASGAAGVVGATGGTLATFDPWFPLGSERGFLNLGLASWVVQRAEWSRRPAGYTHPPYPEDVDEELEEMLGELTDTGVRELALPGPVRLPDMLDMLLDCWSPISNDSDSDPDW